MLGLIFPILGFIVYKFKPSWLFLFWLISVPLIAPILCMIGGIHTVDDTTDFVFNINSYFIYLYFVLVIISYMKNRQKKRAIESVISIIVVLSFFFFLHGVLTFFNGYNIYINIKGVVFQGILFFIMYFDERTIPRKKDLFFVTLFLLLVETVAAYLNTKGLYAYTATYMYKIMYPEFEKLACGTFWGGSSFAGFIATLFMFFSLDFFSRREIKVWQYVCIGVLCLLCLLLSGSRMPFALSGITLFLIIFLYGKKYRFLLVVSVILAYIGLTWLETYNKGDISDNEAVNRIVNGLTEFIQSRKNSDEDNSTVRLSEKLLDEYFLRSPIIGNGRAALGENSYHINDKVTGLAALKADAYLTYMFVEFGLLGMCLYFVFFFKILKMTRIFSKDKDKRKMVIIFVFYLILSITDGGLWDSYLFPFVFLYYFSILKPANESNQITLCKQ